MEEEEEEEEEAGGGSQRAHTTKLHFQSSNFCEMEGTEEEEEEEEEKLQCNPKCTHHLNFWDWKEGRKEESYCR